MRDSAAIAAVESSALLLRSDRNGIATLTLNRPLQFNALSVGLLNELQFALDAIAADVGVRVVVIAGAGRAFCAGHDLKEMRAQREAKFVEDVFARFSRLMVTLTQI